MEEYSANTTSQPASNQPPTLSYEFILAAITPRHLGISVPLLPHAIKPFILAEPLQITKEIHRRLSLPSPERTDEDEDKISPCPSSSESGFSSTSSTSSDESVTWDQTAIRRTDCWTDSGTSTVTCESESALLEHTATNLSDCVTSQGTAQRPVRCKFALHMALSGWELQPLKELLIELTISAETVFSNTKQRWWELAFTSMAQVQAEHQFLTKAFLSSPRDSNTQLQHNNKKPKFPLLNLQEIIVKLLDGLQNAPLGRGVEIFRRFEKELLVKAVHNFLESTVSETPTEMGKEMLAKIEKVLEWIFGWYLAFKGEILASHLSIVILLTELVSRANRFGCFFVEERVTESISKDCMVLRLLGTIIHVLLIYEVVFIREEISLGGRVPALFIVTRAAEVHYCNLRTQLMSIYQSMIKSIGHLRFSCKQVDEETINVKITPQEGRTLRVRYQSALSSSAIAGHLTKKVAEKFLLKTNEQMDAYMENINKMIFTTMNAMNSVAKDPYPTERGSEIPSQLEHVSWQDVFYCTHDDGGYQDNDEQIIREWLENCV